MRKKISHEEIKNKNVWSILEKKNVSNRNEKYVFHSKTTTVLNNSSKKISQNFQIYMCTVYYTVQYISITI